MAVRNYIHEKHLPYVFEYFKYTGWKIQPTKGLYEVFRATRLDHRDPVLLYRRHGSEFLVANDLDMKIWLKFMKWYKIRRKEEENEMDQISGRQ